MSGPKLVRRRSGLFVPPDLMKQPERADPSSNGHGTLPVQYDQDGRRRIVFTKAEQRKIDAVIKLLLSQGLGIAVGCHSRPDGKDPCGNVMLNEGKQTGDAGYGCQCSRVHFI